MNENPEWLRAVVTVHLTRILDVFRGRARIVGLPRQFRVLQSFESPERASICFVIESPDLGPEFQRAEGCQYREIPVRWHYSTGVELIAGERATHAQRGFNTEHDAGHDKGELLDAGLSYLHCAINAGHPTMKLPPAMWPFASEEFHLEPYPVNNLVKAGSLIAAEIDRQLSFPVQ